MFEDRIVKRMDAFLMAQFFTAVVTPPDFWKEQGSLLVQDLLGKLVKSAFECLAARHCAMMAEVMDVQWPFTRDQRRCAAWANAPASKS